MTACHSALHRARHGRTLRIPHCLHPSSYLPVSSLPRARAVGERKNKTPAKAAPGKKTAANKPASRVAAGGGRVAAAAIVDTWVGLQPVLAGRKLLSLRGRDTCASSGELSHRTDVLSCVYVCTWLHHLLLARHVRAA